MSETSTTTKAAPGAPAWVDLSTDVGKAREFYAGLFGWQPVDLGPEAGGYVMFQLGDAIAAAVGPRQDENIPPAWSVYFATDDADETAREVEAAGGKVIVPAFDVLDSGRMAVFADSTGAIFSVWQAKQMPGLGVKGVPNSFGWCELNTRGVDKAAQFYTEVFGWTPHRTDASQGGPAYTEWKVDGNSFGGAMDQADTGMPAEIPPHWLVYFTAADIAATTAKVKELGGNVMMEPTDYPGGQFSIVADPTGAAFGLMTHHD